MLEWLKRRVWKARDLPKGFAGSNPALSAEKPRLITASAFFASRAGLALRAILSPPRCSAPVPQGTWRPALRSGRCLRCFDFFKISLTLRHGADAPSLCSNTLSPTGIARAQRAESRPPFPFSGTALMRLSFAFDTLCHRMKISAPAFILWQRNGRFYVISGHRMEIQPSISILWQNTLTNAPDTLEPVSELKAEVREDSPINGMECNASGILPEPALSSPAYSVRSNCA